MLQFSCRCIRRRIPGQVGRLFVSRWFRSFVTAAGLALAASGAPSHSALAEDIRIAVVGPITGSNAAIGEQMTRGAQMAVEDINAKGGVLGKKLVLDIADDACDPKQAVAAANDVVGKGVGFIGGHYRSSASKPASAGEPEAGGPANDPRPAHTAPPPPP